MSSYVCSINSTQARAATATQYLCMHLQSLLLVLTPSITEPFPRTALAPLKYCSDEENQSGNPPMTIIAHPLLNLTLHTSGDPVSHAGDTNRSKQGGSETNCSLALHSSHIMNNCPATVDNNCILSAYFLLYLCTVSEALFEVHLPPLKSTACT